MRHPQRASHRGGEAHGGDLLAGPAEGAGGGEARGRTDDVVGAGPANGPGQPTQAESGVGDHDDRADAETGVENGNEVGARRNEQRHPVAFFHAGLPEAGHQLAHAPRQQAPADHAGRAPTRRDHVDDGRLVAVTQFVEVVPERCTVVGCGRSRRQNLSGPDAVAQPGEHGGRVVDVFGNEVAGAFEAVHVGVRHPFDQVVEVAVAEDRVAWAPEHEGRNLQAGDAGGDAFELRPALVLVVDRDVCDETADATAAAGALVRRAVPRLDRCGERRVGESERGFEEGRRRHGAQTEHTRLQCEPQRCRDRPALGLVNGGVEQQDTREELRVIDGPAERHHPAPVMPEREHRTVE